MSQLFSPFALRDVQFRNRIGVAPMCQYSSADGLPNAWHMVHLGSRAVGGAGLVLFEASAVSPDARITPADMGIWNRAQADALRPIVNFVHEQGAVAGIQLAHAGRKGSTEVPWVGKRGIEPADGGWQPLAPSALRFDPLYPEPAEMSVGDIRKMIDDFAAAADLARAAGFQVVELHMGHGYLLHEFLSPITNHRDDDYGGDFQRRIQAPLQVVRAVRAAWPQHLPLFVRLSVTDWVEGGWDLAQSVAFSRHLQDCGVDLVDCSSGSITPDSRGEPHPGYQVPFAHAIRQRVGVATAAVGLVTEAAHAEAIVAQEQADIVLLGRAMLRDPYWPLRAARELGAPAGAWPVQYQRAVAGMG